MPTKCKAAGDPITAMARRLCAAHPEAPARTLARRLHKEAKKAITFDAAYQRIRYQFGLQGGKNRARLATPATKRAPREAGKVYAMPSSQAVPWTPHVLKVVGRVGIMSDAHVPYHSERAVAATVALGRDWYLGRRIGIG